MRELTTILDTMLAETAAGRPVALCAVVKTRGSTPQHAGACMLVRGDMSTLGTLGGGCVEAEVRKRAFELLQQRRSALLDFTLDHDYGWDDGLICGGRMFIGVASIATNAEVAPYRAALEQARARTATTFPVVVEQDARLVEYRVRIEVPPTLLIAGAGHVGQALARIAVDLDFHVVVVDDRADMASTDRFDGRVKRIVSDIERTLRDYPIDAGTFVVIVTRGHQHDHAALAAVIRRPAAYIGLIGSRRKSRMILRDLAEAGVSAEQVAAVHTPIGMAIGAVTVPEIAVSIAGQLIQIRRTKAPTLVEGPIAREAQERGVTYG